MSGWEDLIMHAYRILLVFYPPGFRAEFGPEMEDVFITALADAQNSERSPLWRLIWREIRCWPGSVLREHLRARRREMPGNGFSEEKPPQRSELMAAMVLFLLPILSIFALTGNDLPQWAYYFRYFLFGGTVLVVLGLAISKRLPRWSLSYLGYILMLSIILSKYDRMWNWIYPYFIQSFGPRSYWSVPISIGYVGIYGLIILFSILLGALILVNFLRLLPFTRGIWWRIRADWTQLSFLLYGGLVFGIVLLFDEFQHDEIWKLIAWAFLALGAWLYLRARDQRQRILALSGGATGAMWIVALAKWVLIPLQDWQGRFSVTQVEDLRRIETGTALVGWAFILILLIVPALLNFLPGTPPLIISKEEDPISV